MEQIALFWQATNLTIFGMGFVFLFLILLVFVTKFMSFLIQKITIQQQNLDDELDEETKFVIKQAIKIHTGT